MKTSLNNHRNFRRQRGVVLLIALIMLVAMTLAGIALIRSVDTANLIAGNLAFRQGATLAADSGEEAARTWLLTQNTGSLSNDSALNGYYSSAAPVKFWEQCAGGVIPPDCYDWNGSSIPLAAADAAGNQVRYVIHRLCAITGSPTGAGNNCLTTTSSGGDQGSSKGAGVLNVAGTAVYHYRVTSRVIGPRNTTSYVQTLITV